MAKETVQEAIGKFIYRERKKQKMSLARLSLICFGYEGNSTKISRIEKGLIKEYSIETLDKIMLGLGFKLKNLFNNENLNVKTIENQGNVDAITQLSVNNSEGKIVYESTSKNLSYGEILKPSISNSIYPKEQALSKIEEFKKYLDLGIVTKEEYDSKVFQLKPILLGED